MSISTATAWSAWRTQAKAQAERVRVAELDANALAQLALLERPDRPGTLARVLRLYLSNATELLVHIEQAHVDGQLGELHRALHNLRSSSASVGAGSIVALLRPLELDAKSGIDALDAETLARIQAECAAVERALRARLAVIDPQSE